MLRPSRTSWRGRSPAIATRASNGLQAARPRIEDEAHGRSGGWPVPVLAVSVYLLAVASRLPIALTRRLDGDEAVQGIAALRLLHGGHWTWFFPGQHYGGMLETIPQALFQEVDQGSVFLLRLPLVLIAAGAVLMLAFLALELTHSRLTFLAVGCLAAVFPPMYVLLGSWQTAGLTPQLSWASRPFI